MRICPLSNKRLIRRFLFCLRLVVLVSLGLGLGRPAPAAADKFLEHYSRGLSLYKGEKYQEAIAEFEAAYAQKQLPRTLFNIARTYLKLGKAKEALTYFQRYKELEPSPPPSIQSLLTEGVEQAQKLLAAMSKPESPPAPESAPASPAPPESASPPAPESPPPAHAATAEPAPSELVVVAPPRPSRPVWRLAVGGAGLGIGAGLVGLGISALAVDGQCTSAPAPMQLCQLDFDTRGIGAGLTTAGVLFLGAGIVLMALPPRPARSEPAGHARATAAP